MKYIKDNIIYDDPIRIQIDGRNLTLTYEQALKLGYEDYYTILSRQEEAFVSNEKRVDKLRLFLDSMEIVVPEGAVVDGEIVRCLPFIAGKKWEPSLIGGKVVLESIDADDSFGTRGKPILFPETNEGYKVSAINGAFYVYNGKLYKYTGANTFLTGEWSEVENFMEVQ